MMLQVVSFNQAKELSKLGFPDTIPYQSCPYCYFGRDLIDYRLENIAKINPKWREVKDEDICLAPYLELVVKWLREEKNIHVVCYPYKIDPDEEIILDGYHYDIFNIKCNQFIQGCNYFNYEQALSVGIDKAIEILKENNTSCEILE